MVTFSVIYMHSPVIYMFPKTHTLCSNISVMQQFLTPVWCNSRKLLELAQT
jgi:hypothetical protein